MIDFRYHAMSLAAVFVALAVGLLLGITLGDTNLIADARGNLEASLKKDVTEARDLAGLRKDEVDRQNEFLEDVYPRIVNGMMSRQRVAIIGSAGVAQSTLKSVEHAVEPAGADVLWVAQLLKRPQYAKIAEAFGAKNLVGEKGPSAAEADQLGRLVGRRIARGRDAISLRRLVFRRFSGSFGRARLFAYARQENEQDAGTDEAKVFDGFERGIVAGLSQRAERIVGVESTKTTPSNVKWYDSLGLSSVDNIQEYPGYYSLVAIFTGAKGQYGYKQGADSLVPQVTR